MACSSDGVSAPLRGFVYSAAVADCGPADGPAVAIYLAPNPVGSIEPTAPFVRVYVPVQLNQLTGQVWSVEGINAMAAASFHADASTYEAATTGYLSVTSVGSDNTVTGTVLLQFPSGRLIMTEFRAAWLPRNSFCI
jgi:hypothetical protein